MKEHGKTYDSVEHMEYKKNQWLANLEIVTAHNNQFARGRETFSLSMNKFADLNQHEFAAQFLRPRSTRNSEKTSLRMNNSKTADDVPDSMDWRDVDNVVTPVKDQGYCGSCWAFSAVAAMEGAYNYASGSLNSFSEQELVDCTKNGHYTCNIGGEMSDGIAYIADDMDGYIYTEREYPYTGSSCSIAKDCCDADASTGVSTGITGFTAVDSGDEDGLKVASAEQTIISVGIDASSVLFQLYNSGVYAPAGCSTTSLDHGVAVVGYDTMTIGGDYWIVKNSWGSSWGEDGYIYMARNDDNSCGIATDATYANL